MLHCAHSAAPAVRRILQLFHVIDELSREFVILDTVSCAPSATMSTNPDNHWFIIWMTMRTVYKDGTPFPAVVQERRLGKQVCWLDAQRVVTKMRHLKPVTGRTAICSYVGDLMHNHWLDAE
jgi:hypothetical protein